MKQVIKAIDFSLYNIDPRLKQKALQEFVFSDANQLWEQTDELIKIVKEVDQSECDSVSGLYIFLTLIQLHKKTWGSETQNVASVSELLERCVTSIDPANLYLLRKVLQYCQGLREVWPQLETTFWESINDPKAIQQLRDNPIG